MQPSPPPHASARAADRVRRWLRDGAPPVLPQALDRLAEWWAARPPRQRAALRVAVGALVAARLLAPDPAGTVRVLVAARDLAPGAVVTAAELREEPRPAQQAPPSAVTAAGFAGGRLSAVLPAGGVLTAHHLAEAHPADRVPDGFVALAVPADQLPALPVGAVVDLHGGNGRGVRGAVVLGLADDATWVGVRRDDAGILVEALAWGPVHAAVVPVPAS